VASRRRRTGGPPKAITSENARFTWWFKHAQRGDGEAMVEVGDRFKRGQGIEPSAEQALHWHRKAVRAGIALAPALVGEAVFETDPLAGIVWLMLGFERSPSGDDANAVMASSLTAFEPRLSDEAIHAAQVWADTCRERDGWPDDVPAPDRLRSPFRARPPTPALPIRKPRQRNHLVKRQAFGPWSIALPPAAQIDTIHKGQHLRATWGGVYTQHLVWARLAPGVDIEMYVKRSTNGTARFWKPVATSERFIVSGLDTTSCIFDGLGPSAGQRALKRFVTRDDQVAVLTAVATINAFEAKRESLEAIADGVSMINAPGNAENQTVRTQ
jgi:hypothetical protein